MSKVWGTRLSPYHSNVQYGPYSIDFTSVYCMDGELDCRLEKTDARLLKGQSCADSSVEMVLA